MSRLLEVYSKGFFDTLTKEDLEREVGVAKQLITNNHQKADTGTKMIHLGKNTKSKIISKGISAGFADNTYRGLVDIHSKAKNAQNFTQCDSLLMGNKCGAHTVPYIEVNNSSARAEHEATTSKVDEDQLFYCMQRGLEKKTP